MDLPCPEWQEYVAQKWTGLDPEQKESFTSLCEIDDVFKFAQTLITQDDLDFLQSLSAENCVKKNEEQASKSRERGNSCFKSRDYFSAALHYSQGICFAPRSSEQLSLCYANRSAALYHLQLYQDSLDDIDMALKNGYPSHLLHKLQDRRAQCLRHLSTDQKAKADHPSENRNAADGDRRQAGKHFSLGTCPQAAVGFSLEKGRHLVAKERIAPGEVVLTERPYSLVLIPGMEEVKGGKGKDLLGTEHRFCHRCLAKSMCLIPCGECSYSRYCSEACQREAWLEHHQWECRLGGALMLMGVMAQLALRVTLKAGIKNIQMARHLSKSKQPEQSCSDSDCAGARNYCHANEADLSHHSDSYLSVFHLMHHLSHHSPRLRFLSAVTVATVYLKLSGTGPPPGSRDLRRPSGATTQSPNTSEEEEDTSEWCQEHWPLGSAVLRHMLQLRCNAQAITMLQDTGPANSSVQSSREMRIATALFPTLSLLNHSCCPNTSLAFTTGASASPSGPDLSRDFRENANCGVTAAVRAAKVIIPGQEIFHCYGPHSSRMAAQERRRLLFEQYNFQCQCEACTLQQQDEEEKKNGSEENSNQHESKLQCVKCKAALKRSCKDRGAGFICSRSKCGHFVSNSELNHKLQEIRVNLEKAVQLMEGEKPDKALRLLNQSQRQYGSILSDSHPLQGELADATARAFATMGDWGNAAVHLERSVTAIGSQYGEDSIELGRQLFKLAQLHFNGGARSAALSVIPKVRRLLRLHCGPQCHELQELRAMEDCLSG